MKFRVILSFTIYLFLSGFVSVPAQDRANPDELKTLFDSTRAVEAYTFAPITFEKLEKSYNKFSEAISRGKKQSVLNKIAAEFRGLAENAIKATEVTKITLSEYLDPRNRAKAAEAPRLVPGLFAEAEEQFIKATRKVEDGNSKSGLKEVAKAMPLYDVAELEAIKVAIMGKAGKLIEQAIQDQAKKYSPSTLDKARSALTKCEAIIVKDRYERDESLKSAAQAEYEARHASSIAQSVRSLERNDQAWERLMLLYEIEMQKIGDALEIDQVPFDNGPIGAAQAMIDNIMAIKSSMGSSEKTNAETLAMIKATMRDMGLEIDSDNPAEMMEKIQMALAEMNSKLETNAEKLASLETTQEMLSRELSERQAKEEKIENARSILNPTEGEVLLNATDDIVLRLYGLSFASGSSDITDSHVALLEKAKQILGLFPESKLLVEGHTDDLGERTTNMRLSEKRAFSVMQYLRKLMSIPADKIDAVGYGPDKPIGTNTTKEGRAKNRRIDVLIFQ
jgi:outer membrane protein OmpA-like peptidoglycan-associated protein